MKNIANIILRQQGDRNGWSRRADGIFRGHFQTILNLIHKRISEEKLFLF